MIESTSSTCTGELVVSFILTKAIKKESFPIIQSLGLSINERMLKFGLLRFENELLFVKGVLSNKSISIYCKQKLPKDECIVYANDLVNKLEKMLSSQT